MERLWEPRIAAYSYRRVYTHFLSALAPPPVLSRVGVSPASFVSNLPSCGLVGDCPPVSAFCALRSLWIVSEVFVRCKICCGSQLALRIDRCLVAVRPKQYILARAGLKTVALCPRSLHPFPPSTRRSNARSLESPDFAVWQRACLQARGSLWRVVLALRYLELHLEWHATHRHPSPRTCPCPGAPMDWNLSRVGRKPCSWGARRPLTLMMLVRLHPRRAMCIFLRCYALSLQQRSRTAQ